MPQASRARDPSPARTHTSATRPRRRDATRRRAFAALALAAVLTLPLGPAAVPPAHAAPLAPNTSDTDFSIVTGSATPENAAISFGTVTSTAITITPDQIDRPDRTIVSSFAVTLAIDHAYIGDLTLVLEDDHGQRFTLLDRPGLPFPMPGQTGGGSAARLSAEVPITFSDHAPSGVPAELMGARLGAGQVVGLGGQGDAFNPDNYVPASGFTIGGLDQFVTADATSVLGTWTLHIHDASPGAAGTLHNWQLSAAVIPEPTTGLLVLTGLGATMLLRRRRHRT